MKNGVWTMMVTVTRNRLGLHGVDASSIRYSTGLSTWMLMYMIYMADLNSPLL